jgi:hypothetical protein
MPYALPGAGPVRSQVRTAAERQSSRLRKPIGNGKNGVLTPADIG